MSSKVPRLPNCITIPLTEPELKEIVQKSKDWTIMHGAAMRSRTNFNEDTLQFAPFALLPSAIPSKEFHKALDIQTIFNELLHKIAHNRAFLTNCLKDIISVDKFTANLFKIYETVENEGLAQTISLGLIRCDYMLDGNSNSNVELSYPAYYWKQVEFNTIASGFGWLGPISADIHRYVLQELGYSDKLLQLPPNDALSQICEGILEAWRLYDNINSVILFLIEDVSYNICDQRFHEFEIRKMNPSVKVIRKTLTDIANRGCLTPNNELVIDGNMVSVIYFRAGYEPGHYHSEKEWDARLMMERSKAIKSPSIQYHLAGCKKIQQELTKPGTLEMLLNNSKSVEAVRSVFVGLYNLDFTENNKAVDMALNNPERYILKPQREGGGNNIYGENVKETILKLRDSEERAAWILMERIHPPITTGYIIRPGGPILPPLTEMISELGVFGVIIGNAERIYWNKPAGHMLRTKDSMADEGGVAAGLGALDSPYLI